MEESLPFNLQLQELGKENKSPIFSEPLLDEVTVEPGRMRTIQLPQITDPEKDEVNVLVRVNGGKPLATDDNDCGDDPCYIHFLLDRMLIEIYYPSNYFSRRDVDSSQTNDSTKDVINPQQKSAAISVPVFDENGQLQMIEKDSSDIFDRNGPSYPLVDGPDNDSSSLREENFIEILLDDGSSISTYRVEVIVINIGGGTILPNDLDTDTNNLIIEPNDQIQSQVQEEESNGDVIEISEDEFEFDFLEWLDVQEVRA